MLNARLMQHEQCYSVFYVSTSSVFLFVRVLSFHVSCCFIVHVSFVCNARTRMSCYHICLDVLILSIDLMKFVNRTHLDCNPPPSDCSFLPSYGHIQINKKESKGHLWFWWNFYRRLRPFIIIRADNLFFIATILPKLTNVTNVVRVLRINPKLSSTSTKSEFFYSLSCQQHWRKSTLMLEIFIRVWNKSKPSFVTIDD